MWLSKFALGHSTVAVTMHCWKHWDTPSCPLCHSAGKTTEHVLRHPHASSRETWNQQITQLQSWLSQSDMAPSIQQCLILTLTTSQNQSFWSSTTGLCFPAAQDQDLIGFFGFMTSQLTSSWSDIQGLHYASMGSPHSASLWMSQLCCQLILMTHAMWLSQNQQVSLVQRHQTHTSTRVAIWDQF